MFLCVSCGRFCVQDVCASTQVCVHKFAHMLLIYRSKQDIQPVWGEFKLLVETVRRKVGLVLDRTI